MLTSLKNIKNNQQTILFIYFYYNLVFVQISPQIYLKGLVLPVRFRQVVSQRRDRLVPMRDCVFHFLGHLRVGLVKPGRLKASVPAFQTKPYEQVRPDQPPLSAHLPKSLGPRGSTILPSVLPVNSLTSPPGSPYAKMHRA